MVVIYELLTTLGLINDIRHVFLMELAIGPVFEEWAENITRLVLMVGEHDADAICCVEYWKPKINIITTKLWL